MTRLQALECIEKYPDAKNYVKQSHLENLSPLVEVVIEAILCKKEEFHSLQGNTYMPRKETLDRFAMAAGISFNPIEEATRKENDCYIGRTQAMIMGPDGKYSYGDVCEYEYDVTIRHEEELIADRNSRTPKLHVGGKLIEDKARLAYLALRKVARQRANTGARSRAILSILGMQTGFKDLFRPEAPPTDEKYFLFSRIIVNTKNEMVLGRMLDSITAPALRLYGPDTRVPELQIEGPPLRILEAPQPEDAQNSNKEPRKLERLRSSIREMLASGLLGPRATAAAHDALEHHSDDEDYLNELEGRLSAVYEQHKNLNKEQNERKVP
jgi:hypothetical protein